MRFSEPTTTVSSFLLFLLDLVGSFGGGRQSSIMKKNCTASMEASIHISSYSFAELLGLTNSPMIYGGQAMVFVTERFFCFSTGEDVIGEDGEDFAWDKKSGIRLFGRIEDTFGLRRDVPNEW